MRPRSSRGDRMFRAVEDPLPLKTAAQREGEAVRLVLAEQERSTHAAPCA